MTSERVAPEPALADRTPITGFRLHLQPVHGSLAAARTALRRVIRFTDDDAQSRFLTAFTEVLINAIEEHQRLELHHAVIVTADLSELAFVSVANTTEPGLGVHALLEVDHTHDMTSDRGRGLLMARALVPGATFESSGPTITVTLPLAPCGRPE